MNQYKITYMNQLLLIYNNKLQYTIRIHNDNNNVTK